MRALEAALNATWAMEERALETMLDVLARANEPTPEALEAYRAKALDKAQRASVRDGVAILNAEGPMVKRANWLSEISGATSYDILRRDLQTALDDSKVRAILLNVDSPGGEAMGTGELAQAVFDARGRKPIIAYVGGYGASAAYWLASAADKVVIDPSAILGSIGVQVAYVEREPAKGEKRYRFVSSQSPNKNPDIGTEAANKQVQETIDAMAQVFVDAVARNRGVDVETVLSKFGKGGIFVGQAAVDAGLADGLGTFESVLAELAAGRGGKKAARNVGARMSDEVNITAEDRDNAVKAAVQAEKARIAGLRKIAAAYGSDDAVLNAAIEGTVTVEAFALEHADKAAEARKVAAAEAVAEKAKEEDGAAKALAALKSDEEEAAKAAASKGNEPDSDPAAAAEKKAQEILALAGLGDKE